MIAQKGKVRLAPASRAASSTAPSTSAHCVTNLNLKLSKLFNICPAFLHPFVAEVLSNLNIVAISLAVLGNPCIRQDIYTDAGFEPIRFFDVSLKLKFFVLMLVMYLPMNILDLFLHYQFFSPHFLLTF